MIKRKPRSKITQIKLTHVVPSKDHFVVSLSKAFLSDENAFKPIFRVQDCPAKTHSISSTKPTMARKKTITTKITETSSCGTQTTVDDFEAFQTASHLRALRLIKGQTVQIHRRNKSASVLQKQQNQNPAVPRRSRTAVVDSRAIGTDSVCEGVLCEEGHSSTMTRDRPKDISYNNNSRYDSDNKSKTPAQPIWKTQKENAAVDERLGTTRQTISKTVNQSKIKASLNQSNSIKPNAYTIGRTQHFHTQNTSYGPPSVTTAPALRRGFVRGNVTETKASALPAKENATLQDVIEELLSKPQASPIKSWQPPRKRNVPAANSFSTKQVHVTPPAGKAPPSKPYIHSEFREVSHFEHPPRKRSDSDGTDIEDELPHQLSTQASLDPADVLLVEQLSIVTDSDRTGSSISAGISSGVQEVSRSILAKRKKPSKRKKVSFNAKLVSNATDKNLITHTKDTESETQTADGVESTELEYEDAVTLKVEKLPLGSPERKMILANYLHNDLLVENVDAIPDSHDRDKVVSITSPIKKYHADIYLDLSHDIAPATPQIQNDDVPKSKGFVKRRDTEREGTALQPAQVMIQATNSTTVWPISRDLHKSEQSITGSLQPNLSLCQTHSERSLEQAIIKGSKMAFTEKIASTPPPTVRPASNKKPLIRTSGKSECKTITSDDDTTVKSTGTRRTGLRPRSKTSAPKKKRKKTKLKHFMTPVKLAAPFPLPMPESYVDPSKPVTTMKEEFHLEDQIKKVKNRKYWNPTIALMLNKEQTDEEVNNNAEASHVAPNGIQLPTTAGLQEETQVEQRALPLHTFVPDKNGPREYLTTKPELNMTIDQLYHDVVEMEHQDKRHTFYINVKSGSLGNAAQRFEHGAKNEVIPVTKISFNKKLDKRHRSTIHRHEFDSPHALSLTGSHQDHHRIVPYQENTILNQVQILQSLLQRDEEHQQALSKIDQQRQLTPSRRRLETSKRPDQSRISFAALNHRKSVTNNSSVLEQNTVSRIKTSAGQITPAPQRIRRTSIEVQGTHVNMEYTSKVVL